MKLIDYYLEKKWDTLEYKLAKQRLLNDLDSATDVEQLKFIVSKMLEYYLPIERVFKMAMQLESLGTDNVEKVLKLKTQQEEKKIERRNTVNNLNNILDNG